ncbi:MAG: hypothetical protein Q4A28_08855 [Brachymonas sp.]|nr:hypothetical protein [Brachymonas sp.]
MSKVLWGDAFCRFIDLDQKGLKAAASTHNHSKPANAWRLFVMPPGQGSRNTAVMLLANNESRQGARGWP